VSYHSKRGKISTHSSGAGKSNLWRRLKIFSKKAKQTAGWAVRTSAQSRKNRAARQAPLQLAPQRNDEPEQRSENRKMRVAE
jgi:hypothetical protein